MHSRWNSSSLISASPLFGSLSAAVLCSYSLMLLQGVKRRVCVQLKRCLRVRPRALLGAGPVLLRTCLGLRAERHSGRLLFGVSAHGRT